MTSLGTSPRSGLAKAGQTSVVGGRLPDGPTPSGEPCGNIVSWVQSGLQGTEPWWVDLQGGNFLGGMNQTSTGATGFVGDELLNGTYNWTAGTGVPDGRVTPDAGSFVLHCGNPLTINLNFSVPNATVTFEESGLDPSGDWWVNISGPVFPAGYWLAATSPVLVTTLNSAAYNFSVVPPGEGGVTATPSAGTLKVGVSPISVSFSFRARVFDISFSPRFEGTGPVPWSAEVFDVYYINGSGGISTGSHLFANGTTSAPPVGLANGTYVFNVTVPGGYSASPSGGSLHVDGTGFTVNVTISPIASGGASGWWTWGHVVVVGSSVAAAGVVLGAVLYLRQRRRTALPP